MNGIFEDLYIRFKADTKQFRESCLSVIKINETLDKSFKEIGTRNKATENSFSKLTKELGGLLVAYNAVSSLGKLWSGFAQGREQLALTSIRTNELANDIQGLEYAFRRAGVAQNLLTSELPNIQQKVYESTGTRYSPIESLRVLMADVAPIYQARGMVGVETFLSGLGVNTELALGLIQGEELFRQAEEYKRQLGDINMLTREQVELRKKRVGLMAAAEGHYNEFFALRELQLQNSLLEIGNDLLQKSKQLRSSGFPVAADFVGLVGQGLSSVLTSQVGGVEMLKDTIMMSAGMIYVLKSLGLASRAAAVAFGYIGAAIGVIAITSDKANQGLNELWAQVKEVGGFGTFFSQIGDFFKGIWNDPKGTWELARSLWLEKNGGAPTETPAGVPVLAPLTTSTAVNTRNISVNVGGISVEAGNIDSPQLLAEQVEAHFRTKVGNALAQYLEPIII